MSPTELAVGLILGGANGADPFDPNAQCVSLVRLGIEETAEEIWVWLEGVERVSRPDPQAAAVGCVEIGFGHSVRVALEEPVGDRPVYFLDEDGRCRKAASGPDASAAAVEWCE